MNCLKNLVHMRMKKMRLLKKIKLKLKHFLRNRKKFPRVTKTDWEDFWYNSK